ncbi:MAG TPA: crossover junction endodeoxyribonuclease RuvC [Candidatus Paceibacterota bacterium]|nr:crossover junction endodeoxyribonuclease RuvC [Candidatus Paceibacterota bacterium]
MVILGIDPGTTRLGYAVLNINYSKSQKSYRLKLQGYGCLEPKDQEQPLRLKAIYNFLKKTIKNYNPDYVSLENIFFFKNAKTVIRISEARGVIILAAAESKTPILELTPIEVKQLLTGYGRADKKEVRKTICNILNLSHLPRLDDTSDAMAIAFTSFNKLKKIDFTLDKFSCKIDQ